jgi:catechol 2,3-dioxygenase-like lactoylglutathione lyase family enzyme
MKSSVGHLQINIQLQNLPFYKELFTFLGWAVWFEDPGMLGVGTDKGVSLWFAAARPEFQNFYDGQGMNHLGLSVDTQAEVDEAVTYLKEHNIPALFETPRHRPDFSSPGQTYYQVMFETPDRILIEIVYTGPIS